MAHPNLSQASLPGNVDAFVDVTQSSDRGCVAKADKKGNSAHDADEPLPSVSIAKEQQHHTTTMRKFTGELPPTP